MRFPIYRQPVDVPIIMPSEEIKLKSDEMPLPSKRRMIYNAAKAAGGVIKNAIIGDTIFVTDEKANERFEICKVCQFYRSIDSRCAHSDCGCYLRSSMVNKLMLKSESCPDKKW